eukprot:1154837-Pelagomonas_calceolata.AAC.7
MAVAILFVAVSSSLGASKIYNQKFRHNEGKLSVSLMKELRKNLRTHKLAFWRILEVRFKRHVILAAQSKVYAGHRPRA